jgi:hypothetical protein
MGVMASVLSALPASRDVSLFAIDSLMKDCYSVAAPQGVIGKIFENLAISSWLSSN